LITGSAEKFFANAGFGSVRRDDVPEEICSTEQYREQGPQEARVMRLRLIARHV
jgi:N-acetylglutamate synthase-like GNAT family acetyltransferase